MLFNSEVFLYAFLPLTLLSYYLARRFIAHEAALAVLTGASLVYYGWWNPYYLILLIGSALVNFAIGRALWLQPRKWLLIIGLSFNVAVLALFKYADFIIANVDDLSGAKIPPLGILLPIGISFITFQKIAFLADVYARKTEPRSFLSYLLFVSFFPQLIAGPIVHHRDIARQFGNRERRDDVAANLSIGISIFIVGLAKKVLIADNAALAANVLFAAADRGDQLPLGAAWIGVLSYALQIYFDFSGYSDMALGLGRMFGYHLPINFNAPYRSTSIIEFWRRWHITLSQFLRDYVYIPLGGNRHGEPRRYLNLMIVMLVGGLWHGAAWTYVMWGGLHGLYLTINHLYRKIRGTPEQTTFAARMSSTALTFLAVLIAWVFFRATSFTSAFHVLQAMAGTQQFAWSVDARAALIVVLGYALIALLPDTPRLFAPILDQHVLETAGVDPSPPKPLPLLWKPRPIYAATLGLLLFVVVINLSKTSEFIYFQF